MSDFTTPLDALQAQLAAMIANSELHEPQSTNSLVFNVTPDASGTAIFDMTAAQLAGTGGQLQHHVRKRDLGVHDRHQCHRKLHQGGGENFNGDAYLNST